jgi:signal peptidase I
MNPQEVLTQEPFSEALAKTPGLPQLDTTNSIFELKSLLSIAVIVVFVVTFVVQAFRVPSESMENTLLTGDFLLADKFHFADAEGAWHRILPYRGIRRGDIVVFRYPLEPSTYFVKRVVGLPGDHIHFENRVVYVNGKPLQEDYAVHQSASKSVYRDNFPRGDDPDDGECPWCRDLPRFVWDGELVVPSRQYFVLGDNRDQSSDSRYWGFVPRDNILGRALVVYLSVRGWRDASRGSNGKLFPSGQMLAHILHLARWDRIFHIVR